jgi:hypothetical protein
MKATYRLILYSVLILIISTIGITYWYISDHLLSDLSSSVSIQFILNITIYIGLVGSLIPILSFLILYFLIKKIKNRGVLSLLIIILIVFIIAIRHWFIFCTIFYDPDNPQYFLYGFFGF